MQGMSEITTKLDVTAIRADFPTLSREVRPGVPLIYLDNAATSQKPTAVVEAMEAYYCTYTANVHRGLHTLSEEATDAYEGARHKIARFVNAGSHREVIYTRNTTESINLVAWTWGRANLGPGDTILASEMEHHSNMVPWQLLAEQTGAKLAYIPISDEGLLDMDALDAMLDERVKLVAITHMSNVLGTINPVAEIARRAHTVGALVLVDGAQSVPHMPVDVRAVDADFYAFSGHKMIGPTGIGILYGKRALLEAMPPFMAGGDMIKRVAYGGAEWNDLPWKFEAGTPAIAEAIGLGAAVDYLSNVGMSNVKAHEQAITEYALERLAEVPGLRVIGPPDASQKGAVCAFAMQDIHPHDIAQVLDHEGVAVRAGHHCAMPLHHKFGLIATTRASFYLYNTFQEVDRLIEALYRVKTTFAI
jgi:cysteine desulfurase/selenocysteine lyase